MELFCTCLKITRITSYLLLLFLLTAVLVGVWHKQVSLHFNSHVQKLVVHPPEANPDQEVSNLIGSWCLKHLKGFPFNANLWCFHTCFVVVVVDFDNYTFTCTQNFGVISKVIRTSEVSNYLFKYLLRAGLTPKD